ncbi:MAG: FAD-dependent thymidylate synthase [Actinobacteria bacterium]|nr:FAD-dependent thymidylate synthase [Actinomycetota bacterium]
MTETDTKVKPESNGSTAKTDEIRAEVICDSISPTGQRLTTIEATMHRFVLAEFNTHRVFSRNSASSRAIPFHKQAERVARNPAMPVSFPAEQRGMQGGDELSDRDSRAARHLWLRSRDQALNYAKHLADLGVHKSVVNRILEPYMWHTVIVTSTDWDGFFGLRCNEMAQPEIRYAAEAIRSAYHSSTPKSVDYNDWHMPYIDDEDFDAAEQLAYGVGVDNRDGRVLQILKQISSARCARVSYLTHDGVRDIKKDLMLFDRLSSASPMHASPMEHVATPATPEASVLGNFTGWKQFRHELEHLEIQKES